MDTNGFWSLVDRVHAAAPESMDDKCELLKRELRPLNDTDLRDFLIHFDDAHTRAYDWKLWAAAYVLNGGCSDDAFSDFRASLISRGRAAFERALADPDSLADSEPGWELFFEGYQYVPNEVAATRWGAVPPRKKPFPPRPSGNDWQDEDLPALLPRLAGDPDALAPTTTGTAAPASFAEWKKTPISFPRKAELLFFATTWTLPDGAERFAAMRRQMVSENLNDSSFKSAMRQGLRNLNERLEGHERLIDDALRARGLLTFTEFQAHDGKTLEGILQKKAVTTFLQFDLAQRVIASGIPLNAEERAILTTVVATYKPKPILTDLDALDDDDT